MLIGDCLNHSDGYDIGKGYFEVSQAAKIRIGGIIDVQITKARTKAQTGIWLNGIESSRKKTGLTKLTLAKLQCLLYPV